MIRYEKALELIKQLPFSMIEESVGLERSAFRVLTQDVFAPFDAPPFTNSAMDGYAFKFADTQSSEFKILATIFAGPVDKEVLPNYQPRGCVRVMTGAFMPEWADTVIPVEQTEFVAEDKVGFTLLPKPFANIRCQGEDLKKGELLFAKGTFLDAEKLLVLASFGFEAINVFEQPDIALIATGNELRQPGESLSAGAIYNSTQYFLSAALKDLNLSLKYNDCVADDADYLEFKIVNLLNQAKKPLLLLTTGAVSVGDRDFVPQVAEKLGFEILFHKIAMRPGKPIFLARNRSCHLWIGIPGNPISTTVSWHFIIRQILTQWAGLPNVFEQQAILSDNIKKPESLYCFYRGIYKDNIAHIFSNQGSAKLKPSIQCNAYFILPDGISEFKCGTTVKAIIV